MNPPFASKGVPRRFPKGERKALWSPPQRRNPAKQRKARKPPSPPPTRNPFLVRGFVRLRADEVLSSRGKVPKGRRGRPRGACGMAAPGPPVAKQQCTASLAGARPAGLTAYLGGPLSPSAQSIPPPVRWRRLILGVMARGRCHRGTLQRYLAAVWGPCRVRVRYGLCRWSRAAGNFLIIIKSKAGKHMPLGLGEWRDWGRPGRGGGLSAYSPSACCKVRMFSRITSSYLVSAVSSVGPVTTGSRVYTSAPVSWARVRAARSSY